MRTSYFNIPFEVHVNLHRLPLVLLLDVFKHKLGRIDAVHHDIQGDNPSAVEVDVEAEATLLASVCPKEGCYQPYFPVRGVRCIHRQVATYEIERNKMLMAH